MLATLCRMTRKRPEEILPHLSLGSLGINSSFGLSALRSLLEKDLGARLQPLRAGMTVADLIALAEGKTHEGSPEAPSARNTLRPTRVSRFTPAAQIPCNFGLGMDMQEIATLPDPPDFRADPFYAAHFLSEEIATAMLRPDPRAHLTGVFCAKEAAKKSHPALLDMRMTDFQIAHDGAGKPMLRLLQTIPGSESMHFMVSITHTASMAAATCLTFWIEN